MNEKEAEEKMKLHPNNLPSGKFRPGSKRHSAAQSEADSTQVIDPQAFSGTQQKLDPDLEVLKKCAELIETLPLFQRKLVIGYLEAKYGKV